LPLKETDFNAGDDKGMSKGQSIVMKCAVLQGLMILEPEQFTGE
jgi:hypothetical protein